MREIIIKIGAETMIIETRSIIYQKTLRLGFFKLGIQIGGHLSISRKGGQRNHMKEETIKLTPKKYKGIQVTK